MEIKSSARFCQTQDDVSISNVAWTTVSVESGEGKPFTPDSLIIRNNEGASAIYFRESSSGNIITIDAGEIYETSLQTRTDFQLMGEGNDPNYKVIASIN